MINRSSQITEVDAFAERQAADSLSDLRIAKIAAIRVRRLISEVACQQISGRLTGSGTAVEHSDVKGLHVVGLSHFQAVRDAKLSDRYAAEALTSAGALRALASPFASPFDSALAFLSEFWPAGAQLLELPTEGRLSPFTIRIYREGVEIEPHQDILAAESPKDQVANSLIDQFGANLYLSMAESGGALELFDTDYATTGYKDLSEGPRVVSRSLLPKPSATIVPSVGDLIIFPSRRLHSVSASRGRGARITVSFFIGIENSLSPLKIWA